MRFKLFGLTITISRCNGVHATLAELFECRECEGLFKEDS